MNPSRSAGSTNAPHFTILSTSFVHAALLKRCCRMMRDSWHSVHAVITFACRGPAGSSLDCANVHGTAANRKTTLNTSCFDMNFHLVDGIVQIAAGIPICTLGLHPTLAVSCA